MHAYFAGGSVPLSVAFLLASAGFAALVSGGQDSGPGGRVGPAAREAPPPPEALADDPVVDLGPPPVRDASVPPTPGAPTVGLGEAVRLALEGNFGMMAASDALTESRLNEGVARAQFYPKLVPSYGRSGENSALGLAASQRLPWSGGTVTAGATFRSAVDEAVPLPSTSDLRLTLTQPLLRGFGPNAAHNDLRNRRRAREDQERRLELARQRLAVDVARAFYQVVLQRQLLGVARQSLQRTEGLLEASEARLKVGLVSKLDVFRAELQAAQSRESAVRAETALENALEHFRALLGLSPVDPLEPAAVRLSAELPAGDAGPIETLIARAKQNRRDLHETRDGLDDRRRFAALARQNLLPQLDLNVSVARFGLGTSFSSAWEAGDPRLSVFLSTSYPLERSADVAGKAAAELQLSAAERNLRQKELDVETEVRAGVRELQRIRKSIDLQSKAVEVAEQQRRLANLRYQRGLASNFDVVDAEGSLVLARSALVGLLTGYHVALIDLRRITGELDVEREFQR